MKKVLRVFTIGLMTLIGLVSLFMTTSIFLNLFDLRAKEGNYVSFVVAANFICAFIYLFAGYGLATYKVWTVTILKLALVILIMAFIGLGIHIYTGGIYETKTVGAMAFRTLLTLFFTISSAYSLRKKA
ncbi:MAG: hypothetical protein M9887_05580 [Chitinophagales bacterium]|nr:hypothetical protein [Chitinophagales bacterium]